MAEQARRGTGIRDLLIWVAFSTLLAGGLALYFRYAGHIKPLLDVVTDK